LWLQFFYYMSPNNANWLNASQAAEVEVSYPHLILTQSSPNPHPILT